MKVLVFGAKGWIGGMMCSLLNKERITYVAAKSRADDKVAVETEIIEVQPTHIMSFIGRTHGVHNGKEYTTIDYLEQKGKLVDNVRDNLFSPMILVWLQFAPV